MVQKKSKLFSKKNFFIAMGAFLLPIYSALLMTLE